MIKEKLINFGLYCVSELQASSPYLEGNMRRAITLINIEGGENYVDIIIAVDYASYVNDGKPAGSKNERVHKGWINRTMERATASYVSNLVKAPKYNHTIDVIV